MREHEKNELSHYSRGTSDIEYHFVFGWKELEGIAYRENFDLSQHSTHSGKELAVFDEATRESYIPHVVECSVGTDRLFLTLLFDSYYEDEVEGEKRIVLKLSPLIAPITIACMPLTNKLSEKARVLYTSLKETGFSIELDESGSIGKRYRRHDEIGTPFCVTYDFQSEEDGCVTVRHRDTTKQERIPIDTIEAYIIALLQ